MDINIIRRLFQQDAFVITNHMMNRMTQRSISMDEVRDTIMTGKIIEEYPNRRPYPRCLIVRSLRQMRPIHVVVGVSEDALYLVTAYVPDPNRWSNDFERRENHNEE